MVLFETFAVFERLSREIEIRGEGEAGKIGKPALASEQNRAAMRFIFEVDGIGRG